VAPIALDYVSEHPGVGLEASIGTNVYRLGRPEWALADGDVTHAESEMAIVVLTKAGRHLATFRFEDRLRIDAREALADDGLTVEVLSGDRERPVRQLAVALGIPHTSQVPPGGKAVHVASLAASGRKALMIGDGLNDAPALVAAHTSMAPASAADVGRNAADLVFLRPTLLAVPQAVSVAWRGGPGGEAASPERTERRVGPGGSYRRSDVTVEHLGCIERIRERFERGSDGEEHDRQRGGGLCTISQIDTRDKIRRMIQGHVTDHFEGRKQKCGRDVERLPERRTRPAYCGSALLIAPIRSCARNGLRRYAMQPLAKASS
jgi:3-deoxy-D-manno-octulosonate 8-phosphate phosphatase KdsC-like HAD superfamily phosphatase